MRRLCKNFVSQEFLAEKIQKNESFVNDCSEFASVEKL